MTGKELKVREEDREKICKDRIHLDISQVSGGKHKEFGEMICNQLSMSCASHLDFVQIHQNMEGISPKNQIEGMLAAQMIATHHAAMESFKIAATAQTLEIKNNAINCANKLVRSYTLQMDALNRYRSKGQQKITVEHVSINSGGKAIIGNVTKTENSIESICPIEIGIGEE